METEFTDGVIRLRPFRAEDIPMLFAAADESREELSTWMPWCPPEYSIADSTLYVNTRQRDWTNDVHYSFAIVDAMDGTLIGSAGLNFINRAHQFANLGYWVRSSRVRQGVATRAVRLIAKFGLEELALQRLEIVVAIGNVASQRVAEKSGAEREGVLRNRLMLYGQSHDAVMYSLVDNAISRR